jgi:glycosyltransferase involved in cell wall biosynthesis
MRVIHLLRKYNPAEWGGTETAVHRLFDGLSKQGVDSVLYCPRLGEAHDAPAENGYALKRFRATMPVWGLSPEQRRQLVALGGNLISFDLLPALWREREASVIHTHTLGRLGGIASAVARARRLPLVVSIHGGLFDVPERTKQAWSAVPGGFEWGKVFGFLLQSRRLIEHADAVLACNSTEAALLQARHPATRVAVQPHGIPMALYQKDHRAAARAAFPRIRGRRVLLCVGRIYPTKNQSWLVEQAPEIFERRPEVLLVLAGASTDEAYAGRIREEIERLGIEDRVLLTGGLPPGDPRLIGLFQEAHTVVLPSLSETFGVVLLEAWAAGTPVIASRTSGALALIKHAENGWLFDLDHPRSFHEGLGAFWRNPAMRTHLALAGRSLVASDYNVAVVAEHIKKLYEELIERKHALRDPARR